MKHIYFILFSVIFLVANAQEQEDSINMQAGLTNDVFYSLQNGEISSVGGANWTVAFYNKQQSAAIMINGGRGVKLWKASDNVGDFATITDTVGLSTWTELHDQDTTWDAFSAFEDASTGGQFNYGWGEYNINTHQVEGSRVFMIKTIDGNYLKVLVENKVSGVFHFRYATLDNALDTTFTIAVTDYLNKNYAYLNMDNHSLLDREPSNETYDILFTKYMRTLPSFYPVTGVLSNVGVQIAEVHDLPANSSYIGQTFLGHKNIIGADWKDYDMAANDYVVYDTLTYFVKAADSSIWRLYFTDYGFNQTTFQSTGHIAFNKEKLVDASTAIRDNPSFYIETLYPNPSKGNVTVAFSSEVSKNIQLNVFNLIGKIVYQQNVNVSQGLNAFNIPLQSNENGVYLVQLSDGKSTSTQKLILNK